ncbi:glycine cleavage system aminomethyltransferase GcvT [Paenibacillus senegalensis]|uniref:glycine cleavage system aminomethyltransferase GcvT n=1 Tax=Paenibacillus senegalensis TaxID=1465766 RepID=UPI000288BDC9|nr:glycine cleavage system aminomethyltransferase GcvT [Paenibacillus senegalensis]
MLKRTPLFPLYEQHGARVIDFGGWELPVQFSGIQAEHHAVREKAGLFDVSHMGEVFVEGKGALDFLQNLTTNDVSRLSPGRSHYSFMCYENGGVVDDLLVYQLNPGQYMLVLNAANISKDLAWLQSHIGEADVTVTDLSDNTALLALQGPLSEEILSRLTDAPLSELKPFHHIHDARVAGFPVILSRTGYTGEDGFELYLASKDAPSLWQKLLQEGQPAGLVPAGLGARDTLRFEARLPLYGQELSADITPLEAGLGWFVKLDKGPFIGRDALQRQKQQGLERKLVGLQMLERGIPRTGYAVLADGQKIGTVTSGTQSPTLKQNIGLAMIDSRYSKLGTEVYVEIRGKQLLAKVIPTPFYKRK